jgi:hypothetical protein
MIAVKVGNEDCADRIELGAELSERDQARRSAIDEKVAFDAFDPKASIESAPAAESIPGADELKAQRSLPQSEAAAIETAPDRSVDD